jgi:O-antigen ligase
LKIATIFTALMIGFAPLFFGGNRPVLWMLHAIVAGATLTITSLALAVSRFGREIDLAGRLIKPAVIAWVLLVLWLGIQLIPWNGGVLAHPAWAIARETLGIPGPGSISVDPTATKFTLLRLLTTGAVFGSVFLLSRHRDNAALLLGTLLGFFCFYAAYGLVKVTFGLEQIWWFPVETSGYLTSTFVTRSHAATYLGLGVVVSTALLLRALTRMQDAGATAGGAAWLELITRELGGRLGVLAVVWLLLVTALLLTGSRGGIIASSIAIVALIVMRLLRKQRQSGFAIASAAAVVILGAFIVFGISGEKFVGRVLVSGIEDINRAVVARATLTAAYDHLWTGAGAGTFPSIFPLYRPEALSADGFWNRAHNDYAEALLCLGAPGFAFLGFMLIILNWRAMWGIFRRRRDSHFCMIAIAATILVAIHATVDFSLQIQGITLTYAALLALGAAQSQSNRPG